MIRKRKGQSLEEFVASVPVQTWAEIPLESLTKEEYRALLGPDKTQRLLDLAQRGTARDFVMEAVGVVDEQLNYLLRKFVVPGSVERLFGRGGKIKDLEARIELSFGLGLISSNEQSQLNILRKIRNRFAHDPYLHHFEIDNEVLGLVRSLPLKFNGPKFDVQLRMRFLTAAISMLGALQHRVAEPVAITRTEYINPQAENTRQ